MTELPRLAYCLNVFPGQTTQALKKTLSGPVRRLKELFSPNRPFGIEMHVGERLAEELGEKPQELDSIRGLVEDLGLSVVSVNAFPIGDFHSDRVKSDVFCPTWLDERRVVTTIRAGEILAALVAGNRGSVSTSPGTYRGFGVDDSTRKAVARGMARVARSYESLERRTGKRIVLSIEPEPWGMLETVAEAVEFFEVLEEVGAGILREGHGSSITDDPALMVRRYLGINIDLCHQSVMFEDHVGSLEALARAGISIPKVHVSSALSVSKPAQNREGMAVLDSLGEDRYLHQVVGLSEEGKLLRLAPDIPFLSDVPPERLARCVQLRAHLHVPLHLDGVAGCQTTSRETARAVRKISSRAASDLLVVETYTWEHVRHRLSELERTEEIVEGMAGELGWLKAVVKESESG